MAKVTYQSLGDIEVCLSNGGVRQFFCPNCGSGHVHQFVIDWGEDTPDYRKDNRPRMSCKSCGENTMWNHRLSDRVEGEPKASLELPDRTSSHLTYERNHEPEQQGIWFDYTGFRFKDYYDIELFDGTVIEECRPNGDGWYGNGQRDTQVKRIRLKPDDELDPEYHFTGQERIDHNREMFK